MKTKLFIAFLTALFLPPWGSWSGAAATLSTAFSYQGRLAAGGNPANGLFDLRLTLYDTSAGGVQLGSPVTAANVAVSNGLFSATLDFGASVFNGSNYWIEVAVRPAATANPFRTLTPRQQLTATPYAAFAGSAPWSGLAGIPAGFADGIDNNTTYSSGEGLLLVGTEFRVNFSSGGTAITAARSDHKHAGSDITSGTISEARIDALIARDSEILPTILASDGTGSGLDADLFDGRDSESFWLLGGNSGTVSGIDVLGTTDDQPLEFVVNSEPVLRLQPHQNGPSIIAGSSVNEIATDVAGATIAGGGTLDDGSGLAYTNRVDRDFGTVGGGLGNSVAGLAGTIAGGRNNNLATTADYAVIGGGINNSIQRSAANATIGGGSANVIVTNGDYAAISGGRQNTVQNGATAAAIGGGYLNVVQVNAEYASIGGGRSLSNAAVYGTIAGGATNAIATNALAATVGGGRYNSIQANATNATIPGGSGARALNYGQFAYAGGWFAAAGDAQTSVYVVRNTTTTFTPTELFLDGVGQRIKVPTGGRWAFQVQVVGSSSTLMAGYSTNSVVKNLSGTAALPTATVTVPAIFEEDPSWNVTLETSGDSLVVKVMGPSLATTIRWVATIRTTELVF